MSIKTVLLAALISVSISAPAFADNWLDTAKHQPTVVSKTTTDTELVAGNTSTCQSTIGGITCGCTGSTCSTVIANNPASHTHTCKSKNAQGKECVTTCVANSTGCACTEAGDGCGAAAGA